MRKIYKLSVISGENEYKFEKIIAYYTDREKCLTDSKKLQQELIDLGLNKDPQKYLIDQVRIKTEIIDRFGYINYPGAETEIRGPFNLIDDEE
jgi:hypothetical protein